MRTLRKKHDFVIDEHQFKLELGKRIAHNPFTRPSDELKMAERLLSYVQDKSFKHALEESDSYYDFVDKLFHNVFPYLVSMDRDKMQKTVNSLIGIAHDFSEVTSKKG